MPDFNLGLPEIVVLAVLAIIIFGPEKLPELARKTARVVTYVRDIANNARGQLTEQLGPEFQDLRPQSLAQNLLGDETVAGARAGLSEVRAAVSDTKQAVSTAGAVVVEEARSVTETVSEGSAGNPSLMGTVARPASKPAPYDPEST